MTAKQNNSLFQTPTIILSVECQLLNQKQFVQAIY